MREATAAPGPLVLLAGPGAFGGAQRYLLALLHHLPTATGRPVALLAQASLDPLLVGGARAAGAVVRELPAGGRGPTAVAAALAELGAAAVHVNATDPRAEADLLRAALATGLPTSATVHLTDRWARTPAPPDLPDLLARTAVLLAPSRAIAEHLVTAQGAPAERVVHVPNGVPVPPEPLRLRAVPPGAPLRVACVARLTLQKGVDVLVDALALLPPGTAEVVVAGTGREEGRLRARAAGLPVVWAGFADDPAAVLAGADAYAQPSREDALPLALMEAAAAGLPCVATRVGDVAEHLGGAVLVVEPEDPAALAGALLDLAGDPPLRARLAAAGRERVRAAHTEAALARRTAEALRTAWRARPSRPGAAA